MTFYIYVIRNKKDGKRYVGSSTQPKKRFNAHKSAKGTGRLARAVKETGKQYFSFETLEQTEDVFKARRREQFFIKLFESQNPEKGYNLRAASLTKNIKGMRSVFFGVR